MSNATVSPADPATIAGVYSLHRACLDGVCDCLTHDCICDEAWAGDNPECAACAGATDPTAAEIRER